MIIGGNNGEITLWQIREDLAENIEHLERILK
jgi:hypothetical protein